MNNRNIQLILAVCIVLGTKAAFGQQVQVFANERDAPQPTSTPGNAPLRTPPGFTSPVRVQVKTVDIRYDRKTSESSFARFRGSLNRTRKFVRALLHQNDNSVPVHKVDISYMVEEGEGIRTHTESADVSGRNEPFLVIDTGGFEDESGTSVTDSGYLSTKYRHFKASIVGGSIRAYGAEGQLLFLGSWPNTPRMPMVPVTGQPERTFTSIQGSQIPATLSGLSAGMVELQVRNRPVQLPIHQLSTADQEYLSDLVSQKGIQQQLAIHIEH